MRKLRVGAAEDDAERDADAKADLAVAALFGGAAGQLSRLRRAETRDLDGDRVARRAEVGWAGGAASADVESAIGRLRGGGTPLSESVRTQMEGALGADLSTVRVHSGRASQDLNDRISARAFTVGNDVFFGEHEPDIGTARGAHLYAHELAHVLQQRPQLRRRAVASTETAAAPAPGSAAEGPQAEVEAFLAEQAAQAHEPEEVTRLLATAKAKFGLEDILFDGTDPDQPMIGVVFGPATLGSGSPGPGPKIRREVTGANGWWFVGNLLSDWLIWGGYRAFGSAESFLKRDAVTPSSQSRIRYGPLTSRGFGTYMMADPLTSYGLKGSEPDATNATWEVLKRRRQKNSSRSTTYYVRAHLLNDNLGGPGDDWSNLTVLTQRSNNHSPNGHLKAVEKQLKEDVGKGKHAYAYEVTANYGRPMTSWGRWVVNALNYIPAWDLAVRELWAAEDHIPVSFTANVWRYENGAKRLKSHTVQQLQVGTSDEPDHYIVKVGNDILDLTDKSSLVVQALVAGGAGVLGGLTFAAAQVALQTYLSTYGMSLEDFGAAYVWDYGAMAAALGATIANWDTAKANPWPKDRVAEKQA